MPQVEIKGFNPLINNKPFFDKKPVEISKSNDYTTGNLLDYLNHQKYYKLIDMRLSRQTNISIPQQINFTGKLDSDDGAIMKQRKTILNFSLNS